MAALFSQIPQTVLKNCRRQTPSGIRKGVKIHDSKKTYDEIVRETKKSIIEIIEPEEVSCLKVCDSTEKPDSQVYDFKEKSISETQEFVKPKETSDAIIQADTRPTFTSRGTQTCGALFTQSLRDHDAKGVLGKNEFAEVYKPMFKIPKGVSEPPLKLGLTLRGKKRKVFYPGSEDGDDA